MTMKFSQEPFEILIIWYQNILLKYSEKKIKMY